MWIINWVYFIMTHLYIVLLYVIFVGIPIIWLICFIIRVIRSVNRVKKLNRISKLIEERMRESGQLVTKTAKRDIKKGQFLTDNNIE